MKDKTDTYIWSTYNNVEETLVSFPFYLDMFI